MTIQEIFEENRGLRIELARAERELKRAHMEIRRLRRNPLLSAAKMARVIGVKTKSFEEHVASGVVPFVSIGSERVFIEDKVLAALGIVKVSEIPSGELTRP